MRSDDMMNNGSSGKIRMLSLSMAMPQALLSGMYVSAVFDFDCENA